MEFKKVDKVELKLPKVSQVSYSDEFGVKSVDALKESLTAMKEVRKELKDVYSENKDMKASIQKLTASIESYKKESDGYKKTVESLTSELSKYKAADEERLSKLKTKRLEKLSQAFGKLGRGKTVEELSGLPEQVISEFEDIVFSTLESSSIGVVDILPSQSYNIVKNPESLSKDVTKESKSFAEQLCETLTQQQMSSGNAGKRIKFL